MQRRILTYHPLLGHLFIPNIWARIPHEGRAYVVRTNALGLRADVDYRPHGLTGKRRILVFGDSFSAADGVSNAFRFSDLLQAWGTDLEVLNFALPGSGTDQQFLMYQELGASFSADAVLLCPLIENIRRNIAHFRLVVDEGGRAGLVPRPRYRLDGRGALELCGVPVPRLWIPLEEADPELLRRTDLGGAFFRARRVLSHIPGVREWGVRLGVYRPFPQYERTGDPAWRLMRAILRRWIDVIPCPVILAPLPTWHVIETERPPSYLERFRELEMRPRVRVADVLPAFRRLSPVERRACRFRRDIHPTPRGHAIIARALLPEIDACLRENARPHP